MRVGGVRGTVTSTCVVLVPSPTTSTVEASGTCGSSATWMRDMPGAWSRSTRQGPRAPPGTPRITLSERAWSSVSLSRCVASTCMPAASMLTDSPTAFFQTMRESSRTMDGGMKSPPWPPLGLWRHFARASSAGLHAPLTSMSAPFTVSRVGRKPLVSTSSSGADALAPGRSVAVARSPSRRNPPCSIFASSMVSAMPCAAAASMNWLRTHRGSQ